MARSALKEYKKLSMATNVQTEGFLIENISGYSVEASWTGAPTGKLYIQVSNASSKPTQWITIESSLVDTSDADHLTNKFHLWNTTQAAYRWMRVVYVFTSGDGSLNLIISAKGV